MWDWEEKAVQKSDPRYISYLEILKEELLPAMGCTEPIAIAYGAAKAREILGCLPEKITVEASGNIIKNVKSVVVPNTGGLRGIEAAAAAGAVAGKAEKLLEVIADVTAEQKRLIAAYLREHEIRVLPAAGDVVFDIVLTLAAGDGVVKLRIADHHTNIIHIEKNGEVLLDKGAPGAEAEEEQSPLDVASIVDFVETMDVNDVRALIRRQIDCNCAIAQEGMRGSYGANVGKALRDFAGDDVASRARYMAAAGSDARMNGCEMPVVIVSGSGNQGITASVPVVEYAKELRVDEDELLRAVTLSDLLAIHMKTGIGRLSAYGGAVCAGCAAGAAIAWLNGGSVDCVASTLVNSLGTVSGMVCDGAKASCASKIATSVWAGLLGWNMYREGERLRGGDGIVGDGVEETIRNVGRLGRVGMRETDRTILRIMTDQPDPV